MNQLLLRGIVDAILAARLVRCRSCVFDGNQLQAEASAGLLDGLDALCLKLLTQLVGNESVIHRCGFQQGLSSAQETLCGFEALHVLLRTPAGILNDRFCGFLLFDNLAAELHTFVADVDPIRAGDETPDLFLAFIAERASVVSYTPWTSDLVVLGFCGRFHHILTRSFGWRLTLTGLGSACHVYPPGYDEVTRCKLHPPSLRRDLVDAA